MCASKDAKSELLAELGLAKTGTLATMRTRLDDCIVAGRIARLEKQLAICKEQALEEPTEQPSARDQDFEGGLPKATDVAGEEDVSAALYGSAAGIQLGPHLSSVDHRIPINLVNGFCLQVSRVGCGATGFLCGKPGKKAYWMVIAT